MSNVVEDVPEVEYATPAWEPIGGMAQKCQSPGGVVGVVGPADAQVPPSKWLLSIYGDDVSRPVRRYPSQELAQQHFAWAYCQPTHTVTTQGETHILRGCSKDPLEAFVVRSKLFPNWPSWLVTFGEQSVSVARLDDALAIAAAYVEGRQKTLETLLQGAGGVPVVAVKSAPTPAKLPQHGVFITRNKNNVTGLLFVGRKPSDHTGYWVATGTETVCTPVNSATVAALGLQPGECRALQSIPELG